MLVKGTSDFRDPASSITLGIRRTTAEPSFCASHTRRCLGEAPKASRISWGTVVCPLSVSVDVVIFKHYHIQVITSISSLPRHRASKFFPCRPLFLWQSPFSGRRPLSYPLFPRSNGRGLVETRNYCGRDVRVPGSFRVQTTADSFKRWYQSGGTPLPLWAPFTTGHRPDFARHGCGRDVRVPGLQGLRSGEVSVGKKAAGRRFHIHSPRSGNLRARRALVRLGSQFPVEAMLHGQ